MAAEVVMTEEQEKVRRIRAQCTHWVSGQRPRTMRQWVEMLAASSDVDTFPDVYGEGTVIATLEAEVADLLGKEAGLFVVSGVLAQQAALRVWADRSRVSAVALHPMSHIDLDEADAYARLHHLQGVRIGGEGPFSVKDLEAIREPLGAVVVELPLRRAGYKLPTWEELEAISRWCRENEVPLHFDGARLWESAPFYDRSYAEIAALADSVYVSFYKGLGGLAGCVLAGPADFIAAANLWKRRHGGNVYTVFPYVLTALHGLRTQAPRMGEYHARSVELASRLAQIPSVSVAPTPPQTNAFQLYLPGEPEALRLAALATAETTRIWLTNWFTETALPGVSMTEISVGEATEGVSDEEIAGLITDVLERVAYGKQMSGMPDTA